MAGGGVMQVMEERHGILEFAVERARRKPYLVVLFAFFVVGVCLAALLGFTLAGTTDPIHIDRSMPLSDDLGLASHVEGGSSRRQEDSEAKVVVDVGGAVMHPGVYRLDEGSRVEDALDAAGGIEADADTSTVNRASILVDGQKIVVPRLGEAGQPALPSGDGAGIAAVSGRLVSINSGSEADLDSLPGVGPSTAAAIVEDRGANGPFASLDDLMRVRGIGEKKFEQIKDLICL